jgi:hypothetical protein
MTLVYFNNVKRGFEQDRVKQLADAFMEETNVPANVELQLGDNLTDRCVGVLNAELVELQRALFDHFVAHGFDLRPLVALHIDLRGSTASDSIERTINTRRWNY